MHTSRISIRPTSAPACTIDLMHALTCAVAHEIWKNCGGNDAVNWLEAERFVNSLSAKLAGHEIEPAHGHNETRSEDDIEIEQKPEHRRMGAGRRSEGLPRLAARAMQEGDRVRGPIPLL